MLRTPRTPLRLAVYGTKLAVAGTVGFIAVATGATTGTTTAGTASEAPVSAVESTHQAQLERLMTRNECSATGLGPDVIPGSALVERGSHIEHVSFDDGWAVHTGEQSGTLLAVCRVGV